jgi:exodeoxyribonuclease V alpha subunit
LILVGDRDQLASVEAGAVLADLCGEESGFSTDFATRLREATGQTIPIGKRVDTPLRDNVVVLARSHRFDSESGIGKLARFVNKGELRQVLDTLAHVHEDMTWFNKVTREDVLARIELGYAAYRQAVIERADTADVFDAFNRFRVLCAVRLGAAGVDVMNHCIEQRVWSTRLRSASGWYAGRPVIILRNDYSTALFNGDVGIALPSIEDGGQLRVYFPSSKGFRGYHPTRLPRHDTVYAMTVHKSQGSEFDEVLLLLPEGESKALSRELFYTAITRARRRFDLWASAESVVFAVERRVARVSGLAARLRGKS